MIRIFTAIAIGAILLMGAEPAHADRYYNSMLTGAGRSIAHCQKVYDDLRGYNIVVTKNCGYGMDGTCNKRIKSTSNAGIAAVRRDIARVMRRRGYDLEVTVNSKGTCIF